MVEKRLKKGFNLAGRNTQQLVEKGTSTIMTSTFKNDAAKVWNKAPDNIKLSKTLTSAKLEIKKYVFSLPFLLIKNNQSTTAS